MNITEKNKAIREITKTDFFKGNFKNKLSLKATKNHYNSSTITFTIKDENVKDFFSTTKSENHNQVWRLNSSGLSENLLYPNKLFIELYDKVLKVTEDGVSYYETGDYGNQPSEYWWFRLETESNKF